MIGVEGKASQVKCHICTGVEGQEKLLIQKLTLSGSMQGGGGH